MIAWKRKQQSSRNRLSSPLLYRSTRYLTVYHLQLLQRTKRRSDVLRRVSMSHMPRRRKRTFLLRTIVSTRRKSES
uniref:Uncharacterized protein n=1 Tax=Cryptococcus bacillisporus CA1280 TaxID=1296109 RepID=A0A0D0UKU9_CRYGA|nr:hypothetical protein I312_01923 [Cryptococcus bacillisporus CA1280]